MHEFHCRRCRGEHQATSKMRKWEGEKMQRRATIFLQLKLKLQNSLIFFLSSFVLSFSNRCTLLISHLFFFLLLILVSSLSVHETSEISHRRNFILAEKIVFNEVKREENWKNQEGNLKSFHWAIECTWIGRWSRNFAISSSFFCYPHHRLSPSHSNIFRNHQDYERNVSTQKKRRRLQPAGGEKNVDKYTYLGG